MDGTFECFRRFFHDSFMRIVCDNVDKSCVSELSLHLNRNWCAVNTIQQYWIYLCNSLWYHGWQRRVDIQIHSMAENYEKKINNHWMWANRALIDRLFYHKYISNSIRSTDTHVHTHTFTGRNAHYFLLLIHFITLYHFNLIENLFIWIKCKI